MTDNAGGATDEDEMTAGESDDEDDSHEVVFELDIEKLIDIWANTPSFKSQLSAYAYALESNMSRGDYEKYRSSCEFIVSDGICDEVYSKLLLKCPELAASTTRDALKDVMVKSLASALPPAFQSLENTVRNALYKVAHVSLARFKLDTGKVVKVPYLRLKYCAALMLLSPSIAKQIHEFNKKYILPYLTSREALRERIATLRELADTNGIREIGLSPLLLETLLKTSDMWWDSFQMCIRDEIPVVFLNWMQFTDGFSWMGKSTSKNQWSKFQFIMQIVIFITLKLPIPLFAQTGN